MWLVLGIFFVESYSNLQLAGESFTVLKTIPGKIDLLSRLACESALTDLQVWLAAHQDTNAEQWAID